MNPRNHLFLTLCKRGWGEAILGLRIAQELYEQGDSVSFLGHGSLALLFRDTPFKYDVLDDSFSRIIRHFVGNLVARNRPSSIVLCDIFTSSVYFGDAGVDPQFLMDFGFPIIGIDTWDFRESGYSIDVFPTKNKTVEPWSDALRHRLLPVPILRCNPKAGAYSNVPTSIPVSRQVRSKIRADLGLSDTDRAILFCTARWQQAPFPSAQAKRVGEAVPILIAQYMNLLGTRIRFIHVGPEALPLEPILGERYVWLPPVHSKEFDLLLGSVDLFLSPNISATTVTKAIAAGIPAVVLQNSLSGSTVDEISSQISSPVSGLVSTWLSNVVPLYPFSLWPFSWHSFLAPLLRDNEYLQAIRLVELLKQDEVVQTLERLLFSEDARGTLLHCQAEYLKKVKKVPTAAEVMVSYLR
jgi:hypothetical protein